MSYAIRYIVIGVQDNGKDWRILSVDVTVRDDVDSSAIEPADAALDCAASAGLRRETCAAYTDENLIGLVQELAGGHADYQVDA